MISRIVGILVEKNPPHLIVDCNDIGYEIDVPMSTFYNLPKIGNRIILLTQMIVRDNVYLLYGFLTTQERTIFRELLKISGIGARIALAVLSGMSTHELLQAVTLQDATRFTRVPGIGKKTADRLLLELKDRLSSTNPSVLTSSESLPNNATEILNALLALGYSEKEALTAIKNVSAGTSLSDGIKFSLRTLSRI
ncbi:MAG: Holliday junction branch migration protein RuvA [Burkholderia sp.]|nr:Holliday junction branch migration protein RuvA [Burkholderia sp.]